MALALAKRRLLLASAPKQGGGGAPSWVQKAPDGSEPIFAADFENNQYRYKQVSYSTEAEFNTAIGFTKSGITRVTTVPIITSGTNLLAGIIATDGSSTLGLTAFGTGASLASVGGEVEFTGGGTSNGFRTQVTLDLSQAYQLTWKGRRGTSTQNGFLQASLNSTLAGGTSGTPGTTSTSQITAVDEFGAPAATTYIGWTIVGTASGTQYFDDVDLRKIIPFDGFVPGSAEVMVEFTTPASGASLQVLYQLDANNARDRGGITYNPVNGEVRGRVTTNANAVADMLLGTVAPNTRAKVSIGLQTNNFAGSLNGDDANLAADTSGINPGVSRSRIATSPAAETFTGTIHKVFHYNGRTRRSVDIGGGNFIQRDPFLEFLAAANPYWLDGDSYGKEVGGVGIRKTLLATTGRAGISTAINGRQLAAIYADMQASENNFLKGLKRVVWDGRANGHVNGSIALEQNYYTQIRNLGSDLIVLPPLAVPNDDAQYSADMDAIYAWLVAQGFNTINVKSIAISLATSPGDDADLAAGNIPRSLMLDPTLATDQDHLGQTLITAVSNAVASKMTALGW